jgi:hypothetical protein
MVTKRVLSTGRLAIAVGIALSLVGAQSAAAQPAPIGLGTAGSFAVLAGSTVTNTGSSTISGNVGVSPGSAIVGFPPGTITNGVIHAADAVALQAQADLVTAYGTAAGLTPTAAITADLGGQTLVPGVYAGGALSITGTLTLDAQGDPNAVFVFLAASTLITASTSNVNLINGANHCNVFWQVTSSATLGTNSVFAGTIMALASVTAGGGAMVQGRLLAQTAAVTLNNNVVNSASCTSAPPSTTTTTPGTTTTTPGTATTTPGTATTAPGTGGGEGTDATTTLPTTGNNITAPIAAALLALLVIGAAAILTARRSVRLHSLRATDSD